MDGQATAEQQQAIIQQVSHGHFFFNGVLLWWFSVIVTLRSSNTFAAGRLSQLGTLPTSAQHRQLISSSRPSVRCTPKSSTLCRPSGGCNVVHCIIPGKERRQKSFSAPSGGDTNTTTGAAAYGDRAYLLMWSAAAYLPSAQYGQVCACQQSHCQLFVCLSRLWKPPST